MNFNNIPEVKIGIVAVSRDCFPASLAENRRKALVEAYQNMAVIIFTSVLLLL